ncbi:uncharacterized protein LOC109723738 isoform X2 [Ananas comosus]|uniref:Uncharacterized protein LOC109723738 isoform X2 n=1 Tax=Ananas comosus TaxID=4615 RepID=A0A6P5GJ65_ANACO|nr:uncharacterized protein LOC109723738 isoform X2 [Ananas comosus]
MEGEITPVLLRAAIDDESPISCCLFEGGGATAGSSSSKAAAARDRFEEEKDRILRDLQQMINRYNECFHRLRRASADVDALRRENLDLVAEKLHLTFLVDDREASAAAAAAAAGAKRKETKKSAIGGDDPDPGASDGGERNGATRGGIPKSISIRSRGFLATAAAAAAAVGGRGGGGEASWRPQRLRVPAVLPRDLWRRKGVKKQRGKRRRWRWRCTAKAWRRQSCATNGGSPGVARTQHGAASRTGWRSCAPCSATRATRPSFAACSATAVCTLFRGTHDSMNLEHLNVTRIGR